MTTARVASGVSGRRVGAPHAWVRARGILLSVVLAACLVMLVVVMVAPTPAALDAAYVTRMLLTALLVVVPWVQRSRPWPLWAAMSATWLLVAIVPRPEQLTRGVTHFEPIDILNVAGFLCAIVWILGLTLRLAGPQILGWAMVDTLTLSVGVTLLAWALARMVLPVDWPGNLAWAMFPIVDVAFLGLLGQLVLRQRGRTSALYWFVAGIILLFLVDVAGALVPALAPGVPSQFVAAFYVLPLFGFLGGVTHPDMRDLGVGRLRAAQVDSTGLRNTYLVLAAVTGGASLLVPSGRTEGSTLRAVLLLVLMVLLVGRLVMANHRLSTSEARSQHRARHDELTGLTNRTALVEDLRLRVPQNFRDGRRTALLYIDCDSFKDVNDAWGHSVGDGVLRRLATSLRECVGEGDLLARHGGDEFVVVSDVEDMSEAQALADRIHSQFDRPVTVLPWGEHTVTVSIGLAVTAAGEWTTGDDLLGRADIALRTAKTRGRGSQVVFDAALREQAVEQAMFSDALRATIDAGGLWVAFQPIYSGRGYAHLSGWEALARWNHPRYGEVPPSRFIPLAEDIGLICQLGDLVLHKACREFAEMCEALQRSDLSVSVNVSAAQLLQSNFVDTVARAVQENSLRPEQVILELTESLLVDEDSPAIDTLRELRALVLSLSIDDFGTGYASISTLLQLPFDGAKVDRSLVKRLDEDPASIGQVRAVLELVKSVGIRRITAEGIETPEQAVVLEQLGCPRVQGYYFGRPAPSSQFLPAVSA